MTWKPGCNLVEPEVTILGRKLSINKFMFVVLEASFPSHVKLKVVKWKYTKHFIFNKGYRNSEHEGEKPK